MEKNSIRIVAAVVDTRQLTMYKEDGTTIIIPQGDARLRRIITEATPQLVAMGYADVVINDAAENHYASLEKQTGGVVKFFKIAKAKLAGWFAAKEQEPDAGAVDPVEPVVVGQVPTEAPTQPPVPLSLASDAPVVGPATEHLQTAGIHEVSELDEAEAAAELSETKGVTLNTLAEKVMPSEVAKAMSAVEEILQHAVPVTSVDFHEHSVAKQGNVVENDGTTDKQQGEVNEHPDTIIAVVDGDKIIPNMEKIKSQFARANKLGSTTGVENFLKRLGAVINKRSHSIEDLLKFMERADTPIADDGSIIIYKVLKKANTGFAGRYVDCHTGKVEQWAGAYVCMDESLVDRNRNNECSNGLHVARRGYIREFSGDVCVLAKLAPEDVIAVPSYDANKMRVCGYHILMELTNDQYSLLKQNRPITDREDGQKLLAAAIAGKHIGRTHEVRITEQKGGGVKVSLLKSVATTKPAEPVPAVKVTKVEALGNPAQEIVAEATDPKEVVQQVEAAQGEILSRKEQAKVLYDACASGGKEALDALHAFKKASKTSWEKLGLPDLNGSTFSIRPPKQDKHADKVKPSKVVPSTKPVKEKKVNIQTADTPTTITHPAETKPTSSVTALTQATHGEGSPRERIAKLLAIGLNSVGVAQAILELKKKSKKSWDILGVTEAQVAEITRLTKG